MRHGVRQSYPRPIGRRPAAAVGTSGSSSSRRPCRNGDPTGPRRRRTSARRSPRSNSGSSSGSSGPASPGWGWWLRCCACSGSPRLLKRQLPAWPTGRSCLVPSIFAGRSLSPKCSGGPFSRGHGGPFSCCRYQGREPRRHRRPRLADRRRDARSTKAGARTPATPGRGAGLLHRAGRAQRRPGREPRRHAGRTTAPDGFSPAQRRPGREPRRHRPRAGDPRRDRLIAQRRPGREPRRHRAAPPPRSGRRRPLNEGRGANPGDTAGVGFQTALSAFAQRRPGREPRRHLDGRPATHRERRRSTKAGARTPATRWPAPRGPCRRPALNEGRGANPGDTATKARSGTCSASLNEGRGANPGDTPARQARDGPAGVRSTKAGARTPATRSRMPRR